MHNTNSMQITVYNTQIMASVRVCTTLPAPKDLDRARMC